MVISGSGDGSFKPDTTVAIKANAAPSGKVFDSWVVSYGDPSIANINTSTTILTMPVNATTVAATYKKLPLTAYTLTVISGSGEGGVSFSLELSFQLVLT